MNYSIVHKHDFKEKKFFFSFKELAVCVMYQKYPLKYFFFFFFCSPYERFPYLIKTQIVRSGIIESYMRSWTPAPIREGRFCTLFKNVSCKWNKHNFSVRFDIVLVLQHRTKMKFSYAEIERYRTIIILFRRTFARTDQWHKPLQMKGRQNLICKPTHLPNS